MGIRAGFGVPLCPARVLRRSTKGVLQIRNKQFFSLESWRLIDMIRDAMASHKTDTYGHNPNPSLSPCPKAYKPPLLLGEQ
jgi:hypothetical protein